MSRRLETLTDVYNASFTCLETIYIHFVRITVKSYLFANLVKYYGEILLGIRF